MTTLNHYCSADAFWNIVRSRTIRLTSLDQSNDSMEGRLMVRAIDRLISEDEITSAMAKDIRSTFMDMEAVIEYGGLGFCLTDQSDDLSQWRGYASDGAGFMIGFDPQYFRNLVDRQRSNRLKALRFERVEYDEKQHLEMVRKVYEVMKAAFEKPNGIGISVAERLKLESLNMLTSRYLMKPRAFSAESESRLFTFVGEGMEKDCDFMVRRNELVPFRPVELSNHAPSPICKVILGPKNRTPLYVVEAFLKRHGFPCSRGVVSVSSASYR